MTHKINHMEVSEEMLEAGWKAWAEHEGNSHNVLAVAYLAMKAKELPLETVERVARAIAFHHYTKAVLAMGQTAPKTLPESYNWSKHIGEARAAIAAMGDDGLREALEAGTLSVSQDTVSIDFSNHRAAVKMYELLIARTSLEGRKEGS